MPIRALSAALVRRMFSTMTCSGVLPGDQPRGPLEAELDFLRLRRPHVDVVVRVVADRVAASAICLSQSTLACSNTRPTANKCTTPPAALTRRHASTA